ncbi:DUF6531 domain-containing protein [Streptomyces sp. N2-109]|uniref:DUF6531 domain-containing protein n=1 Tax=Streptomyces gossypii TaxID=2883101 RepID=A0ABT2JRY4_9ACTN|nr:RHS repeat-associated core domain-containing protein [Streptomyces gossypii]MCT2590110.1 DUF6531 domain-containing protein [Streptomyces gossypii]
MGIGDFIPDPVEDFFEDGAEVVGEGVDDFGDWSADRLEDVGWESGADWVRETSDSAANVLGADVGEMQLGQTEDPKKLIHGSVSTLRSNSSHLKDFKNAFNKVGNGLKGLESDQLKGKAADTFREKVSIEPKKWFKAAGACEKASKALGDFADTVEWAQGRAKTAIEKYKAAKKESEEARTAHNTKVDEYTTAAETYNAKARAGEDPGTRPVQPGEFKDPGIAGRNEAEEILKEARTQRNTARTTAETAVSEARDEAPAKPSYSEQVQDGLTGVGLDVSHALGGVIKGSAGLVSFVRSVNPTDPYNVTHPAEYLTNLNSTVTGLVQVANDPVGTAQNMWDTFKQDPAEGVGRLLPELLGTKGLGAAKKTATVGRHADDGPPGRSQLDKDSPGTNDRPDADRESGGTDPVDLATGRMYLPQTDVTLSGALPLVFARRLDSGYRAGRWFGPSWSSTADQRLEIDSRGVVLVTADGLLLAYPHPAPGVPTLPESGPRLPLERTPEGDYTLSDPDSGRTWLFRAPDDDGTGGEARGGAGGADGEARLEQISDRNGHRIDFEYDETGAPSGIVHSSGRRLRLTTQDGRITALHLEERELVRYGYTDGNLTEVVRSSGLPLRFDYDDEHRVIAWTDTNGRRYDYVYDNRDRCIAEGGTAGHLQVRIGYGAADPSTGHRVTTVTTVRGRVSRYVINDRSQVIAAYDPTGAVVRTRRDHRGRVLSRTDALGRTTRFHYDEEGRLSGVTRPDGCSLAMEYNALGLPVSAAGADGARWALTYDAYGNRTTLTDPSGRVTRYGYDGLGHLSSVKDPSGAETRVRCDAAGLPVEVTDPGGGVTRYARDAFGHVTALTDPRGAVTRLEWSAEGRLTRRTDPDGAEQRWTHDGEGNCVQHVDASGGVTSYEYTHFDLLAARTDPDGTRYEFDHDTDLRLTGVTNPQGLTWSYVYDEAGRPVSETDFDGRTLTYAHDAAGQLVSRTNPAGQTVSFARDIQGRIVRKDVDGHVTTYGYDPAGRLTEALGPDAELRYHRDKLGRVKSELVNGRVLNHSYDPAGRRTRRVTPSGAVSTFGYDLAGNRTTLTASGHTLGFTHDAAGRETERSIGPGTTLQQDWDPVGRLTGQTLTSQALTGEDTGTLQRRSYSYRPDGHLTALTDKLGGDRSFELDLAGRVTAVHAAGWSESYAYDEAGNQTHADWPGRHPSPEARGARSYTGTRVHTAGKVRYEYDEAGRIVLRQKARLSKKPDTWRYRWDAEDRLTQVVTPDGTVWRYRYDALGRRTAKQRLDSSEQVAEQVDFTWDGPTLVEQTTTAPGLLHPVTLTWDHDGLTPLCQTERLCDAASQTEIDSRFFAIVTDLVGTPTELVDESGGIAWHTQRTLWGTTTWNRDATAYTPLRFPGQYHDPETGLHYNFHRYYDPETARYTSPDPLGLAAAPNPAAYVRNPHAWTDPQGLTPCRPWIVGKGDDPIVPELADEIHARYPGHVKAEGIEIMGPDGKPLTDFDLVTENAVIQVKSGGGKGALDQALRTQALTDRPVIVYLPTGKGSVVRSLEEAGIMVTRDKETLMGVIAP